MIAQDKESVPSLGYALYPGGIDRRLLSVFAAYFDESGTHDGSSNLTVGGFVASVEQWKHFDHEWTELLQKFGLLPQPGYFRMAEYESRRVFPYTNWPNTRHQEFAKRLVGIIKRRVNVGIAASMPTDVFNRMSAARPSFWPKGYPYATCAQVCLKAVGAWFTEHHPEEEQIASVFAEGTTGAGLILRIHADLSENHPDIAREYRLGGIGFDSPKRLTALQAADFFAYETYKRMNDRLSGIRRRRKSVESLMDLEANGVPVRAVFIDKDKADELVAALSRMEREDGTVI